MFMLGITASRIGSVALANILYNMDTFNVDVSNLRTIDNAGSEGATADGAMYGSNHIYLGATQSVDYVTVNTGDYAYFDVTTKIHVKATATGATTTISTPTHHSNFFSLKAGKSISAGDLTALNANPEDISRIVNSVTPIGTYSFGLADIEAFYPGNEGSAGSNTGQYVQDIKTALSSELVDTANSSSAWTPYGTNTVVQDGDAIKVTYVDNSNGAYVLLTGAGGLISNPVAGKTYLITAQVKVNTGSSSIQGHLSTIASGIGIIDTTSTTYVDVSFLLLSDGTVAQQYMNLPNMSAGEIVWVRNISFKEISSYVPITNYTASCRTTYKNTNYGASNFLYTQDATGRLTGMHTSGHIKSGTDGRNITIAMTVPYNHIVTKDIDKIEGSLTSCTITYSDTTTLVVP